MNRSLRPGVIAAFALLEAMPTAEPAPTVVREPAPSPFRDHQKIQAAEVKRARRAAKWRKEGRR